MGSLDKKAEKGTCSLALTGTSSLSFSLHASKNLHQNYWILDSGASDHMTCDLGVLSDYEPCDQSITVFMADETKSLVQGTGTVYVASLSLKSMLYVPNLGYNLLSQQDYSR